MYPTSSGKFRRGKITPLALSIDVQHFSAQDHSHEEKTYFGKSYSVAYHKEGAICWVMSMKIARVNRFLLINERLE